MMLSTIALFLPIAAAQTQYTFSTYSDPGCTTLTSSQQFTANTFQCQTFTPAVAAATGAAAYGITAAGILVDPSLGLYQCNGVSLAACSASLTNGASIGYYGNLAPASLAAFLLPLLSCPLSPTSCPPPSL